MDRGDIVNLFVLVHLVIGLIMILFSAIQIFIISLILPTAKKIKKRIGKLIDKGIAKGKNPRISAVLSIITPGLGQIYNGEVLRGVLYIILIGSSGFITLISLDYGLRMMIISGLLFIIIEIIYIIDAYRIAVNINRFLVEYKKMP